MDFSEFDEFEMMPIEKYDSKIGGLVKNTKDTERMSTNTDKMVDAVTGNFKEILALAGEVASIKKMQVQSDAILKKLAEDRKTMVAEAEAYALKRNADTKSVVDRMNVVRLMMKDFYDANTGSITSEDFRIIITEAINQMGKLQ